MNTICLKFIWLILTVLSYIGCAFVNFDNLFSSNSTNSNIVGFFLTVLFIVSYLGLVFSFRRNRTAFVVFICLSIISLFVSTMILLDIFTAFSAFSFGYPIKLFLYDFPVALTLLPFYGLTAVFGQHYIWPLLAICLLILIVEVIMMIVVGREKTKLHNKMKSAILP